MEKEIRVRKKRFAAFWAAVLMVCTLVVPVAALEDGILSESDTMLTAGTSIRAEEIVYQDHDGTELGADNVMNSGGWRQVKAYTDFKALTGQRFTGWTVVSKTGTANDGDVVYPQTVTLKAVLETISYQITFDTNGGTEIDSITKTYGENITAPSAPTREGYEFTGWNVEFPYTVTGDTTITASWQIKQCTITFDTDGGSAIEPIKQDYGTAVTPPSDPTKEEYIFDGWDQEIPATMPAKDITITAKWKYQYIIEKGTHALNAGVKYQLGSGVTQVDADPSTYASGAFFYVPTSGTYTFS